MQDLSFPYTIIRSRRKTIAIRITREGAVHVLCPQFASKNRIDEIVHSKQNWIEKKLHSLQTLPPVIPFTPEEISALKTQAQKNLPSLISYYAAQIGVSYGRVTVRSQKSRWGSCSAKGNLNFNCLLMLAPPEVRDYVVVHELCHRLQLNHSPAFWALVEKTLPDYRARKQWLKTNGAALIGRLP